MNQYNQSKLGIIEKASALVGGAVRDTLLNLQPKDLDYVVEGFSHNDMIAAGFKTNDLKTSGFPVYRHPITHDEYALARTERSTGNGYRDFEVSTDSVTIIQDLGRRDITINSMAMLNGELIDPHGGSHDLSNKIIRHTNDDAFMEDPVRILRIARFATRFHDFSIAQNTIELMINMIQNGMLDNIKKERVWLEISKTFQEQKPSRFFYVLQEIGALKVLFPEIFNLIGVDQNPKYHAEGDVFVHTMFVLDQGALITRNLDSESKIAVCWACLTHDIGKPLVNPEHQKNNLQHIGHDTLLISGNAIDSLHDKCCVPLHVKNLAILAIQTHQQVHSIFTTGKAKKIADFFEKFNLKSENRRKIFEQMLLVCDADEKGRILRTVSDYKHPTIALVDSVSIEELFLPDSSACQIFENGLFSIYKTNHNEIYSQKFFLQELFDSYIKINLTKEDTDLLALQIEKINLNHDRYIQKITEIVSDKKLFDSQKTEADKKKILDISNAPKVLKASKFVEDFKKIKERYVGTERKSIY